MKTISIDLEAILHGVGKLENLKSRLEVGGIDVPEIQGSGDTAQAIYNLAKYFKGLEKNWELLIEESCKFFSEIESVHESEQRELSSAMIGTISNLVDYKLK